MTIATISNNEAGSSVRAKLNTIIGILNNMETGAEVVALIDATLGSTVWKNAGADGADGADGTDGVGIADVTINESNHLIVTLTDLSEIDAGLLPGATEYGAAASYSGPPCLMYQGLQANWTALSNAVYGGLISGDIVVMARKESSTPSTPTGWTLVASQANFAVDKIEYAGQTGTLPHVGVSTEACYYVIRGATFASTVQNSSTQTNTSASTFPNVTPSATPALHLAIAWADISFVHTDSGAVARWVKCENPDTGDVRQWVRDGLNWSGTAAESQELGIPSTASRTEVLVSMAFSK